MNNSIICKNCENENPFYALICSKCKSYLRERIYNIDLWKILGLVIESPTKAFTLIIQSEHKNFISFIMFIASVKFFIDSMYLSIITDIPEPHHEKIIRNYFIILGFVLVLVIIIGIAVTIINKSNNLKTRIRDNIAVFIYSLLPHAFAFLILFTVELAVFGGNLFAKDPTIFTLKEFFAFTLLGFEGLIILWAVFLSIIGIYVQTKNKLYSIVVGIIFNFCLYCCLYLGSTILYR
ncbi:MAG: hypothetical protein WCA84_19555 [Ignavibacteriaceae bacterium]